MLFLFTLAPHTSLFCLLVYLPIPIGCLKSFLFSITHFFYLLFLPLFPVPSVFQMDPTSAVLSAKWEVWPGWLPGKFRELDPDLNLRISHPFRELAIGCLEVPSSSFHKPEWFSISIQAEGEQTAKCLSPLNPKQKCLFPAGHRNEQICRCSIHGYYSWMGRRF